MPVFQQYVGRPARIRQFPLTQYTPVEVDAADSSTELDRGSAVEAGDQTLELPLENLLVGA